MRTDHELQRDVIAELEWQPSLRDEEIGVAVKDGVVTLSGTVANYARKFEAEKAAEKVHGVKAVALDLTVKLGNPFIRSDSDVAHAAIQALKWDIDVPDEKIKLRVEDGRVLLEGEVEWQYQRAAAERAIRYLYGVKSVSNLIGVKPAKISATNVSKMITDAFKRSANVDSSRISVESKDGTVILKGSVRSWAERRDAENAAWAAPGVTQVDDRLAVAL
ncbi:MAG TPA: BON domain-containing protein [Gemmatimonadaceae bacterium]|nr:BON domain-containing protein [Gemmatimonadaceae bacterium]